ncbi:aminotransferase class I/II-fold pyridoxal phosphate-dependent enzyme [Algibacter sp. PT7-4]|uniref:aminotransferase class I/II-fold pyridoxal phosphate-dependent enzyme n=1 Tax=Algibacter ulvanivorans TaxID=3400999 RepID=UPI003AAC5523
MESKNFNRRRFLQFGGMAAAAATISPTLYASTFAHTNEQIQPLKEPKIRLFSNENPYGPSKKVQEVIAQQVSRVNRYSSFNPFDTDHLIETIAQKHGLDNNQVIIGHGSFDILRMLTRAYGKTKNSLIMPGLTFNVVGRFADKVYDHKQQKIPLTQDMSIDLKATEEAVTSETQLVFICNPNNPTGKILDASTLETFCKWVATKNCLVVVDEAYIDMLTPNMRPKTVQLLQEKHNVLIVRTFSKAYGMAGLRIGYALGLPETIARIKSEYHTFGGLLNNIGVAAAITALKDNAYVEDFRVKNDAVKTYVQNNLSRLGIEYIPSYTNFILINVKDITKYRERLKTYGIEPIGGSGKNYPNWSRISISTQEDMAYYLKAVKTMDWLIK